MTSPKRPFEEPPMQTPPPSTSFPATSSPATSSPPPQQQQQQQQRQPEDLLSRVPTHDWKPFTIRLCEVFQSSADESNQLMEEYRMWNWLYEIWSTSRNEEDTLRLGRDMATIIRWTRIKEEELERAREQHTEDMMAISSVLGIVPRGGMDSG